MRTLVWAKSDWNPDDPNFHAEGFNESQYTCEPGPPITLTWWTRSGKTVLGKFPSLVQAQEAAEKHHNNK